MLTAEKTVGVIVVDHGSRRDESNRLLLDVVAELKVTTGWPIVEPAHMELAEPSIAVAFERCVDQGAERIIVHPYFLGPGRHWKEDIPALTAAAAQSYPGVDFQVTPPLGPHPLLLQVVAERVEAELER